MRRPSVFALAGLAFCGCLPGDTRPPPAEVTVTVSSSTFTLNDIPENLTADGFSIHIERLLVSIGQSDLGDGMGASTCNEYSNPGYTRLFDFKQLMAPTELGLAFATGRCAFGFAVRFPNPTTLLGTGASEEDAALMRTAGSDHLAMDAGVSVYIEGTGTRDDVALHFAWPFRKRVAYSDCYVLPDTGGPERGLSLSSGEKASVNLEIHGEAFFLDSHAAAHFEPFARADQNSDGNIAFDELWTVPLTDLADSGFQVPPSAPTADNPGPSCNDADGNPVPIATLGDYAYCVLLPALVHYQGTGSCTLQVGRPKNDD